MLWVIGITLILVWLLGLVSSYSMGGFIHLLLVAGLGVLLLQVRGTRR